MKILHSDNAPLALFDLLPKLEVVVVIALQKQIMGILRG
jgi:hypothetical protein